MSETPPAVVPSFSFWQTFKHHIPRLIVTLIVDVVFPLLIYLVLQRHIKPVYALLIAGAPPLVMVLCKAVLTRTFDALAFLICFGFVISGVVAIITRNPIIVLLEKSLVTGILSVVCAFTLIPLQCCHHRWRLRPLGYYFYLDLVPTDRVQLGLPDRLFVPAEAVDGSHPPSEHDVLIPRLSDREEVALVYEWLYANCASFRVACYVVTSVWSFGFLAEFLARLALILVHLSVGKIVIYGNVILTSITALCISITAVCVTKERKKTMILIEQWKSEHLSR